MLVCRELSNTFRHLYPIYAIRINGVKVTKKYWIVLCRQAFQETNRLIKLTNRLLMLTSYESIINYDATVVLNEVIEDYELIYEQLKIEKRI